MESNTDTVARLRVKQFIHQLSLPVSTTTMAEQLLTPSTSVMPTTETPPSAEPKIKPITKQLRRDNRTFDRQQKNDRAYYRKEIKAAIRNIVKWESKTPEQRWEYIRAKRQELMQRRVERCMGTTQTSFKDLHDEEAELEWLRMRFMREIGNGGAGAVAREDQDDDEQLPSRRGVKRELEDDADDASEHDVSASQAVAKRRRIDEEEAKGGSSKPVVYKVVSRGLATAVKETDPLYAKAGAKTGFKVVSRGCIGLEEEAGKPMTRRRWRLVDGRVVVWPPF